MSDAAQPANAARKAATAMRRPMPRPTARAAAPQAPTAPLAALAALQASAGNRAASLALRGTGVPLPAAVREDMESRFGEAFSNVRIHDDAEAHASAANMHAKAYTHGHDIVFGADRFAPQTVSGKRLLAHELAHVVQQRRGGAAPPFDAGAMHEAFARQAADSVATGASSVAVRGSTGVGIAREPEDKKNQKRKKPVKGGEDPTQVRGKEILEEFEERAHDPNPKAEFENEKLRNRSGASERARHADRLKDIDEHHGFPKFLGGNRIQTYIRLTKELHYLYHEELYALLEKEFKQRGVLAADARRNARRSYGRLFSRLDPKAQAEILGRIVEHAEGFDKRYAKTEYPDKRQRLAAAVRRGIKEAKAEGKATLPSAPGKSVKAGSSKSTARNRKVAATGPSASPGQSGKPAKTSESAPAAASTGTENSPKAGKTSKPVKEPSPATSARSAQGQSGAVAAAPSAQAKAPAKAVLKTAPKAPAAQSEGKPPIAKPAAAVAAPTSPEAKPAMPKGTPPKPAATTMPGGAEAPGAVKAPAPPVANIPAAPRVAAPEGGEVHLTAPKPTPSVHEEHLPTPKTGGRMRGVAGHGVGVLFAMAMAYLAGNVQGDVEQERADALAKQEAPGLQAELQRKLDEQASRVLTLQAQNPMATVWANVTYDSVTWESYVVAGDDVITGSNYEGTWVEKVEVGYLPLPQSWVESEGSAAQGGSEDHHFKVIPVSLNQAPFESLIAHAKANALPLDPLRAYCRARIAEAGQASDSGAGPRMDAYWRDMLTKIDAP